MFPDWYALIIGYPRDEVDFLDSVLLPLLLFVLLFYFPLSCSISLLCLWGVCRGWPIADRVLRRPFAGRVTGCICLIFVDVVNVEVERIGLPSHVVVTLVVHQCFD